MIFTWLITGFLVLLSEIIDSLPFTIPPLPTPISVGLTFITNGLGSVTQLLRYAYTPIFFTALIVVSLAVLLFDYIYGYVFWVLRKIPFIDIH